MITYDIEKLKTLSKFIKEILEVCSRSLLKKFLHNLLYYIYMYSGSLHVFVFICKYLYWTWTSPIPVILVE